MLYVADKTAVSRCSRAPVKGASMLAGLVAHSMRHSASIGMSFCATSLVVGTEAKLRAFAAPAAMQQPTKSVAARAPTPARKHVHNKMVISNARKSQTARLQRFKVLKIKTVLSHTSDAGTK